MQDWGLGVDFSQKEGPTLRGWGLNAFWGRVGPGPEARDPQGPECAGCTKFEGVNLGGNAEPPFSVLHLLYRSCQLNAPSTVLSNARCQCTVYRQCTQYTQSV